MFNDISDVVELVDFRLGIEVEAAGLAAMRHTDVQLLRLERAAAALRANPDNPSKAVEADFDFHHSAALATGNRFYADLLVSLGPAMIVLPRHRLDTHRDGPIEGSRFGRICDEHDAIHSAIAARNELAARAAMRLHLVNSRERLRLRV
nr:FCD domain-containing protein [Spelaeicoccus albus]